MASPRDSSAVYQNYIGGRWLPSSSVETFDNRNPANTDDLIGRVPRSNASDVEAAVAAARDAFPHWRLVPAPKRAEILYRAAQILADRKEDYARTMTREMGKILDETRGDVQEAIDMCYLMAGEGRRMFGQTVPSELRDKFAMSMRQPIGVCGMITAWNFPIAVPSWKILPALVCGNTVVFKPAEEAPASGVNFVQALADAGVPAGVLNLVLGDGPGTGAPLVAHPDVRVVSFTGSTETGRLVNQACAPGFKKVHLEMGGKNVIIVMDDADLELAVDGALWGGFGTSGQRCTAASRVVVHESLHKTFVKAFVERAAALRVGDGLDPSTQMGPSVSLAQIERVIDYVRIGREEGATVATGGDRLSSGVLGKGYFHEPTIFTDVAPAMRVAREEIFGPVVSVLSCRSLDEAIAIANDVAYGLSASIYTQDINRAFRVIEKLDTGMVGLNQGMVSNAGAPFGGVKQSGYGREGGPEGLHEYLETKYVAMNV